MKTTVMSDHTERVLGKFDIEAEVEEVTISGAIEMGFKQEWVSGSGGGWEKVEATSGAGLGSPWLGVTLERGDEKRYFRIHIQSILGAVAEAALKSTEGT